MKGLIVKRHSNFYYVKVDENARVYECMLRERLKKEDQEAVVGDYVEIDEVKEENNQAVITKINPRKTFINRPPLANMEQSIIVMSLNQPALNLMHLDRFIVHTQLANLNKIICVNKCDLKDKKKILPRVHHIYEKLGIEVLNISAKEKIGIDELKERLKNKKSIFSGPTGVGKSTILNVLDPSLNLKTGDISLKTQQGMHTTRFSELIEVNFDDDSPAIIADTPGFSYLKFDIYLPEQIEQQFSDFAKYRDKCFYSNCLHLTETDCFVKKNLNKISGSRYENYCRFVSEAIEYKERLSTSSIKEEGRIKTIDSTGKGQIRRLKLGHNLVDLSRKAYKQKLSSLSSLSDDEEPIEDDIE